MIKSKLAHCLFLFSSFCKHYAITTVIHSSAYKASFKRLNENLISYMKQPWFMSFICSLWNSPAWHRYSLSTGRQRHRKFVCFFFRLMFSLSQYLTTAGGKKKLQHGPSVEQSARRKIVRDGGFCAFLSIPQTHDGQGEGETESKISNIFGPLVLQHGICF